MYAIINTRTKKWVSGTNYRYSPVRQITSTNQALTYETREQAKGDMENRKMGKEYKEVEVTMCAVFPTISE